MYEEYAAAWRAYKAQRVENSPEYWLVRDRFASAEYTVLEYEKQQP